MATTSLSFLFMFLLISFSTATVSQPMQPDQVLFPNRCAERCGSLELPFPFHLNSSCGPPVPSFRLSCRNSSLLYLSLGPTDLRIISFLQASGSLLLDYSPNSSSPPPLRATSAGTPASSTTSSTAAASFPSPRATSSASTTARTPPSAATRAAATPECSGGGARGTGEGAATLWPTGARGRTGTGSRCSPSSAAGGSPAGSRRARRPGAVCSRGD
ncbi:putative inactive receptor-like protein kinase [Iris pallida]|uniref:Inactive receptor-like protein kinase n=1 Tax=Iris pallida TaxID=29817 RepID=A0AAX6EM03_IRIPA|nr:putative inactive receptor-like protein kinase [Iris pallida]